MEQVEFFTIDIEQTDWQASEAVLKTIRHSVFVDEQQIPIELDVDRLDSKATHWIAYDGNNTPMATARLLDNGHIGRMAVLKSYRNKGVGGAIMRRIICFANNLQLKQLRLDAQRHAVPFYQSMGFKAVGSEFMEANIPHFAMVLEIPQSSHPKPKLPDISQDQQLHKAIDGRKVFLVRARQMAQKAEHCVRVFSDHLNPEIYNDKQLCEHLFQLASRHPNAQIRVLVRDNHLIKTQHIALAELAQKLSSHVFVRQLNTHLKCLHSDFLVFDSATIIYQQEQRRMVGYSVEHAPREALELIEDFDQLWDQSQPDPEVRQLHI